MSGARILIVDDEPSIRFGLHEFLEARGYRVSEADSLLAAQEACRADRPDAALVDYLLPDGTALDLLPRLRAIEPDLPVVILTGHGTIDLAVRAMKEGAEHFLTKPVELPAVLVLLERMLIQERVRRKQLAGETRLARDLVDPFPGAGPAMRQLGEQARKVAAAESPVLITGETGSGKGVLARWLHQHGPRSEESFVDLNCAGLSRELLESELFGHTKGAFTGATSAKQGLLEVAHRGTVFLDEIGDLDIQVQPKLLKVLEEKRFRRLGEVRDHTTDIRLIAATHHDLAARVQQKEFRGDLFFRINTIHLVVPPLRERSADLPLLAEEVLGRLRIELGRHGVRLSAEALARLQQHAWPGNVRELRNVLERAVLLSDHDVLRPDDFSFDLPAGGGGNGPASQDDGNLTLEQLERRQIERVLTAQGGRVAEAAKRLGIPKSTLYQKLKTLGITPSKT